MIWGDGLFIIVAPNFSYITSNQKFTFILRVVTNITHNNKRTVIDSLTEKVKHTEAANPRKAESKFS
jgi:hypothetical protein